MAAGGGEPSTGISTFVTAPDGIKLHVRCYGPPLAPRLPVVCLPGLTRTAADFDRLAPTLALRTDTPRRVLAIDYRGRGLSDSDPDPTRYTLLTELADLQTVLAALAVPAAVFIGTSRGGLLTMLLAAVQPAAIAGAVLNDIGPVIEPAGLQRIKGYVGRLPVAGTYEDGARIFRDLFGSQFPRFSERDWLAYAHRSFRVEQDRLVPSYDLRMAETMESIDFTQPLPTMWPQFDALGPVPLMVLRGQNSDLLSEATVAAMRSRRPSMEVVTVANQGHAPVLDDDALIERITGFVAICESQSAVSAHSTAGAAGLARKAKPPEA